MSIQRFLTAIIGLPLIVLMLIFANKYVIDAILMIMALICMDEYFHAIKGISNPIKWVGYLSTILVFLVAFLDIQTMMIVMIYSVPAVLLILFLHVILTDMKINFKDAAYTFLGIFYITYFIVFLSLVTGLKNGKAYLGYGLAAAWGTDVYAYLAGKYFGKHHFSKVSPKKSIEGCIGGLCGAVIMSLIFVYGATFLTTFEPIQDKLYLYTAVFAVVLSIVSQIGDFVASSIKRYAEVKDYGNLLPGHGGMLDRVDSVIFIAPLLYILVSLI